jgi:prepilin-type N-terminal cleavage/methylation domain-containing protein/prepilin-type processing-associated H-X9-DG protein
MTRNQVTTLHRRAFSLLELLVVMAIIGVLMGLLLPAIQQARESAWQVECKNNLKQIGLGLLQFEEVHRHFPPGILQDPGITLDYGQPRPYGGDKPREFSFLARILPYVGHENFYAYVDLQDDYPWPNGERLPNGEYINGQVIKLYQCPSYPKDMGPFLNFPAPGIPEHKVAHTDYLGINGTDQFKYDGILHVNSRVKVRDIDRGDGMSKTFIVGERPRTIDQWAGWWFAGSGMFPWFGAADVTLGTEERIAGSDCACAPSGEKSFYQKGSFKFQYDGYCWDKNAWHFWSAHPGGAHFLYADGHVEFVSYNINLDIFRARGTYAGGEADHGQ